MSSNAQVAEQQQPAQDAQQNQQEVAHESHQQVAQQSTQQTAQQEGEVTKYRTQQQQDKADNAIKQEKRETGQQSNRSRSSSRRERRKRIRQGMDDGKYMKTNSLEALEEADASGELQKMGMFERIGPDSTSMDGPVTKARAERGEIPVRGTDPNQPYYMQPSKEESVR